MRRSPALALVLVLGGAAAVLGGPAAPEQQQSRVPSPLTLVSTVDGHVFAYQADAQGDENAKLITPKWSANLGGATVKVL